LFPDKELMMEADHLTERTPTKIPAKTGAVAG